MVVLQAMGEMGIMGDSHHSGLPTADTANKNTQKGGGRGESLAAKITFR